MIQYYLLLDIYKMLDFIDRRIYTEVDRYVRIRQRTPRVTVVLIPTQQDDQKFTLRKKIFNGFNFFPSYLLCA